MKNLLLFYIVLLCTCSFAQTSVEKQTIISSYDSEMVKETSDFILSENRRNKMEVESLLLRSSIPRVIETLDGRSAFLRRVIDGFPIYYTSDNVAAAKSTRANFLHTGGGLGLNIDGQNMNVATWDGGPALKTHVEFMNDSSPASSRLTTPDASASNSQSLHSTHVAGTIAAKGVSANAKGMAPKCSLISFDWDNDSFEAFSQATENGLLLSNHSYGVPVSVDGQQNAPTWLMGCYSSESREWDVVSYGAPYYLMVASAGNDGNSSYSGGLLSGYDKLTGNKNSKNNLVVANAEDAIINPNGSGALLGTLFINSSSSQGPSDDGRVKPDITGNGTGLFSASSTSNSSYATLTGTSMAAPNVTGTLLLLQQYYNQINGQFMLSSTLKGLACHTADDTGNLGPDPIFGWGLLNAKKCAETIKKASDVIPTAVIKELSLSQGQTYTFQVSVASSQKLEASICWTDVPGVVRDGQLNSSSAALVNDLDIRIKKDATTFFPWKLNLSNVANAATTGDNTVDNIERVAVNNPAGTYTIEVKHKGTLVSGPQNFSLVITGAEMALDVESFDKRLVKVWPNPATSTVSLNLRDIDPGDYMFSFTDVQGRKLIGKKLSSNDFSGSDFSFDVSMFPPGLYFVSLSNGTSIYNAKVIKK